MSVFTVVGSGASGVHFALSLLRKDQQVRMLDVGYQRPTPIEPEATYAELPTRLLDPVEYFVGSKLEGLVLPTQKRDFYAFPPSKSYVFRQPSQREAECNTGFAPLSSFARGGLAEAWTGGCYPFNDAELREFPFGLSDLLPYYDEVARRIGVCGATDDLAAAMPVHAHLLEPLALDAHSALLLERYRKVAEVLYERYRCRMGFSRTATLSRDADRRKACQYLGRCLWDCPIDALYTPSITLEQCQSFRQFEYIPDRYVKHFRYNDAGLVTSIVATTADGQGEYEYAVDVLALAAGTLSTGRIVLQSILEATGEIAKLPGLMDNRQIMVPFFNLGMLGRKHEPKSYQYHQLCLGLQGTDATEYVHCQITTLTTAQVHAAIQTIPTDLRTAILLFRHLRSGLGVVNLSLHDYRRQENYVSLTRDHGGEVRLRVNYAPPTDERSRIRRVVGRVRRVLRRLGCVAPPGMERARPMGSSVHYAGTMPMRSRYERFATTPGGRSYDFPNLHIVDGSTFPILPAKNITFSLMANASRIADELVG